MTLEQMYERACAAKTDIHEHLPLLRSYAARARRVVEFGTGGTGQSTTALLAGQPESLVSYDIEDRQAVARALMPIAGRTKLQFVQANTHDVQPTAVDFLFIDSMHTYDHIKGELVAHAPSVTSWIGFHDTNTFGQHGEVPGSRGIWPAIEELLAEGAFRVVEAHGNNNGLVIVERIA